MSLRLRLRGKAPSSSVLFFPPWTFVGSLLITALCRGENAGVKKNHQTELQQKRSGFAYFCMYMHVIKIVKFIY